MNGFLGLWYRISLPKGGVTGKATTPDEREHLRYARLTSGFLGLFMLFYIPSVLLSVFSSPSGSSSNAIMAAVGGILVISFILGKRGLQRASAVGLILYLIIEITSTLATNPLDPALFSINYTLLCAVVLAGALLPPVATLVVSVFNSIDIVLLVVLHPNTVSWVSVTHYAFALLIFLPVSLQLTLGIMDYVVMRNLVQTIRRADRAEEIIALQQAMAEHEEGRLQQQARLEEGIRKIAETHARIANGDFSARVSLTESDVLWAVAVPLNNLLNRLQTAKQTDDTLAQTQRAAQYVAEQLRTIGLTHKAATLSSTGTFLDPVILELNKLTAVYQSVSSAAGAQ
jgi:hypothetical protein